MKRVIALALTATAGMQLVSAAPDPVITPAAKLTVRQDAGNSLLGFVSTAGQESLTDLRSCDFPATLTISGSFAQCCAADTPCNFFSTCKDGTLFAPSTSVFCDQGYCNTGVIIQSVGGRTAAKDYLGCWATSLGEDPITLVQGDEGIPQETRTGSLTGTLTGSLPARSSGSAGEGSTRSTSAGESEITGEVSVPVESSDSPQSTGGAARILGRAEVVGVLGGVVGAGVLGLL